MRTFHRNLNWPTKKRNRPKYRSHTPQSHSRVAEEMESCTFPSWIRIYSALVYSWATRAGSCLLSVSIISNADIAELAEDRANMMIARVEEWSLCDKTTLEQSVTFVEKANYIDDTNFMTQTSQAVNASSKMVDSASQHPNHLSRRLVTWPREKLLEAKSFGSDDWWLAIKDSEEVEDQQ